MILASLDNQTKEETGSHHMTGEASFQQIYEILPENRVNPNDKLTKTVFDPSDNILESGNFLIRESRMGITTRVTFSSEEINRFDVRDREVGMACFSLYEAGNRFATTEQIYRVMTERPTIRLQFKEEKQIRTSLERLIGSTIKVDLSGVVEMGYKTERSELFGSILPAKFVTGIKLNGSRKTVIQFLDESPLVTLAKIKNNQLITYSAELLNTEKRMSIEKVAIRNYVRRRIEECRNHKQMIRMITFDNLFQKNGLNNKSSTEKQRYREYLMRCFRIWKENGVVSDYEIVKSKGRAHGYHGMSFSL